MIDPHRRWARHGEKPDYAGLQTFAGMPYSEDPADLAGIDVAVFGAPMDELVSDRPGARFGPRAIRNAAFATGRHLEAGIDPFHDLAILDYGEEVRSAMSVNHNHAYGRKHQVAEFRFEGTEGAAHVRLGALLDYPNGEPDELTIRPTGEPDWVVVPLRGAWFPDAFVGRMANLQRFVAGEDGALVASVEDAWTTMALVEAAFESSVKPATALAAHP